MFDGITADRKAHGTGSTGASHPFRNRIARQVRLIEEKNLEQNQGVTQDELVCYGIPFCEEMLQDCAELSEIERFEEERGFERRGVDFVMGAFMAARNDHEEVFDAE